MPQQFGRRRQHTTRAKHAAEAKEIRGKYQRSIRGARLAHEAETRPAAVSMRPKVTRRRIATASVFPTQKSRPVRWMLLLGLMPFLLVGSIGIYIFTIIFHAEHAVQKISRPSVAEVLHGTSAPDLPRPTSTPSTQGTIPPLSPIAPVPTIVPAPTALPAPRFDRKDPFTILLLGVDTRVGADDPAHSDTMILLYVDPLEKSAHLLSIPRDLRVTQATGSIAKITDVYANGDAIKYKGIGGVALVWDTIEQNFRIKIDYYAQVNFAGVTKIIDAVGGVTVDNPYPIKDDQYPTEDYQFSRVFFPAGLIHLYGAEALQYARTRHDDNDFQRNNRQQQIILGVRAQAVQLNLLTQATGLIDALGDTVQTDFPKDQWLGFAKFSTDLHGDAIKQYSLNDLLFDQTINGIYYAGIDWQQALGRIREFSPKENFAAIQAVAPRGTTAGVAAAAESGTRDGGLEGSQWITVVGSLAIRDDRRCVILCHQ